MTEEYYYKNKAAPDGFNPYCKEDTKKRSRKRQLEDHEKYITYMSDYNKVYYSDPVNKKNRKSRCDKLREKGYYKEYQQENKDYFNEYARNRRMNKAHEISNNEWEECKNYFNYRCAYCNLAIEEHYIPFRGKIQLGDFHRDHVDPEGANDLSNCVPSCRTCNLSKHNSSLEDWYDDNNPNYTNEKIDKIHNWLNEDYKDYIE
jgi:hypothetical protein